MAEKSWLELSVYIRSISREAENLTEIGELVTGKSAPVDGVSRTVTCLAIHPA